MKKLNCFIIVALLAFPLASKAQLRFGLRAGIQDNVRLREVVTDDYKIDYKLGTVGFHFGVTSQLQIWKLFVQPEILFSTNTNSVKLTDINSVGDFKEDVGKETYNKLDVPVLMGLKFDRVRFAVGPVFTANLNSKSDLLSKNGIDYSYNNATVGYQIGVGLEFDRVGLELRYEDNLSDRGTAVNIGNKSWDTDDRASQLMLSVVYYFEE